MDRLLIKGGRVFLHGSFRRADLLCENGMIARIGELPPLTDGKTLNADGLTVIPGLIDAHTHGAVNIDANTTDENGLRTMAAFLASQGTTAFHASLCPDTDEVIEKCLGVIQTVMKDRGKGACLLGAHMEGPFLSPDYKGALSERLLRKGDASLVRGWLDRFPGVVRYLTVSPEVEGVQEIIREFSGEIVIAIGHSGATYDQAMQAFQNGARCVTHTFNGMRLFHQHEPAIMGAALESDCWCEAICDGRHLVPGTVRMLLKCKGYDRVMAITDSMMAAGLPDGRYHIGVNDVTVVDGDAKLTSNGSRAGSTLTSVQGLRNLLRFTEKPLEKVLPLLTANPAEALRISDRKGRIEPGLDADLVLLDDRLRIRATCVGGEIVYSA